MSDNKQKDKKLRKAHRGSLSTKLSGMEVGESAWLEATEDSITDLSRRVTASSRYPEYMKGRRFTCRTFTAVSATKLGEIAYLLRIERVA